MRLLKTHYHGNIILSHNLTFDAEYPTEPGNEDGVHFQWCTNGIGGNSVG